MTTTAKSYELTVPDFFDPTKVGDLWRVPYEQRQQDALELVQREQIAPAAKDQFRLAVMPIDVQLTFCNPDAALFVAGRSGTGALDDTVRTAEFIYRNLRLITKIIPTMDTHTAYQIFHEVFWIDEQGNHPAPASIITLDEVKAGKWRVNPAAAYAVLADPAKYNFLQAFGLHYVETLTSGGKYPLMIWPYHAMLGDVDHALVPTLQEACFFHSIARGAQTDYRVKGGNPLTENYSVLSPEVLVDQRGRAIDQKNTKFIEALLANDALVICGQAKSHCVAWAIDDLLTDIQARDPQLAKKVYLVEDLTSAVVIPGVIDFTDQADEAFERFAKAGMNIVKSTDAIADWPGIQLP